MEPDFQDIQQLMTLEKTIESATEALNEAIKADCELEILLIRTISLYPEIKDTLSFKNKVYELRRICKYGQYEVLAEDWIRSQMEIKKAQNTLRQVVGMRDSVKKKLSIEDRLT